MLTANIATISVLLVLALVILAKKNKKTADYFLLLTTLLFALYPFSVIWIYYSLNKWSFGLYNIASYCGFIPFFIYAMLLISRTQRFNTSWLKFLIPHLIFGAFVIGDLFVWNDYSLLEIDHL